MTYEYFNNRVVFSEATNLNQRSSFIEHLHEGLHTQSYKATDNNRKQYTEGENNTRKTEKEEPTKCETRNPQKTEVPPQCQKENNSSVLVDTKSSTFESWGRYGRQYAIDTTTGSATYEVKRGDTYSAVARDVLEKRNGREYNVRNPADRAEILKLSRELTDFNGVKWGKNDFVLIRPGDKIRIPPPAAQEKERCAPDCVGKEKPEDTKSNPGKEQNVVRKEPQLVPGAPAIQPQGRLYNLLQPPGLEGRPGESWSEDRKVGEDSYEILKRNVLPSSKTAEGEQHSYTGEVGSGMTSGTNFKASEVIDANGRIVQRKIEYEEPLDMRINDPASKNKKLKVMAIEAQFDYKTGTYVTQCRTSDGVIYKARQAADGSLLWGVNTVN